MHHLFKLLLPGGSMPLLLFRDSQRGIARNT
jgi:hypothetical protein